MTCIVGIEHDGQVTIGGDSAGVAGLNLTVRADEKVWEADGFVFGFTSSFRMGQLLRYSLRLPDSRLAVADDAAAYKWMVTEFVDAVRKCLKTGGFLETSNGEETAGTFLVGWRGRLYTVGGDLQVGRSACGYDAVGCGGSIAVGSLHATASGKTSPVARVKAALTAAEAFSAGVRGPFQTVAAKAAA